MFSLLRRFRFARLPFASRQLFRCTVGAAAVVVAAGSWSGCASTGGDYSYVTTISTGERMTFPLKNGQPALATAGTITVRHTSLARGSNPKENKVRYEFVLEDKSGATPKSVRVEDVSDKPAMLVMEDAQPTMENKFWHGLSEEMTGYEPLLGWLSYLDSTTRIFRFTVTTADGREVVLYQAWMVPAFAKAGIRSVIGLKV